MNADKPAIAVLMAIYEPRLDWLKEQLDSLEAQTYPNLRLYIRDDCSSTVAFEDISRLVSECVKSIPFEIKRNEKNLGSNRCFERLSMEAREEYYAYCDQDDIWLPDKLAVLEACLRDTGAGLACSDVIPIDGAGQKLADSITELRPRHTFRSGPNLAETLIYRNFVIGCTMLIRRDIAVSAVPFAKSMVHDHYLAFVCSVAHSIAVAPRPLVRYRIHGGNQTGILAHITTKAEYLERHLLPFCQRVEELRERYPGAVPESAVRWANARMANWNREAGGGMRLFALRGLNRTTSIFELTAPFMPECLFRAAVRLVRGGRI